LMLRGELAPEQRRHTEMIVQSGRSMMMLLNDILDLSKIEAGQFAVDMAPVDLHATLLECVALHRPAAEQKGLDLLLEPASEQVPDTLRPWIITDGLRLRQIVLNLLANAVKFTAKGQVRLHYTIEERVLRVSVADSGIGIEPDRLDAIFAPFTQGDKDIARSFGGTGLGLSISRRLAALLGGGIEVESTPGAGSCFTLTIPANPAPSQVHNEVGSAPTPVPASLPQGSRVLLAEDHDVNRLLIQEMLERCDITVAMAHDGHEAITMVIDSLLRGRPYDLVLMDVQMPGCDGYAATRAIRAEGIGPDLLPIIALSANAFPDDIAASRGAGMQAHLAKPVDFARLVRLLQRWLPTRIVEAGSVGTPATQDDQAEGAFSPGLQQRWITRRTQAIAALQSWLNDRDNPDHDDEALATMLHKLAGTAALFGEADLGEKAAALEHAIRSGQGAEERAALVKELLALALADTADSR
jgi:two-component system, sensor histidine kinase